MTEKKKSSIHCRSRFRILSGDLIALGPGKVDLLESIGREGSISQAARERHLSYRRAWNMVDTMNQCFNEPLVVSVTGGKGGGGAKLTPTGKKVIQLYRKMGGKSRHRHPNRMENPAKTPHPPPTRRPLLWEGDSQNLSSRDNSLLADVIFFLSFCAPKGYKAIAH